jgi:DNA replication protein DnaC
MEACKHYFKTRYVRLPDLLLDLEHARNEGNYKKVMARYTNPVLLIIDEWLLLKPTPNEAKDIFELLNHRRKRSQPSSVLNTVTKVGMSSLVVTIHLWQMQF